MKIVGMTCLALGLSTTLPAQPNSPQYLALGDSVPFGMNITLVPPYSTQPVTASEFVGYPDTLAAFERLSEVNAACPGETSGSFLNIPTPENHLPPDNGCNSQHVIPPAVAGYPTIYLPPFKTSVGLHTPYLVAQMDFAVSELTQYKTIRLVTLSIGANDILLALPQVEAQCGTNLTCAQSALAPTLTSYAANLGQILSMIRAYYGGTLIVLNYYSPQPALNSVTQALNTVMAQVVASVSAASPGVPPIKMADGYTAFQVASAFSNGDACQAGLLIKLPPSPYDSSPCDVHPSPFGRDLLAATVELAQIGIQ
jgi:lysophospholipase L1-like esterase